MQVPSLLRYDTILKKELEKHIKTHLRKLLRKKKVKQIASKPMCPQCGLFIKCHSNLMKHVRRVHLKEKYFFCDLCE